MPMTSTAPRRLSTQVSQTLALNQNAGEIEQEVRRRERVARIFPNGDAAFRLIGAVLADMNEAWMERRHLDMTEFYEAICSDD